MRAAEPREQGMQTLFLGLLDVHLSPVEFVSGHAREAATAITSE